MSECRHCGGKGYIEVHRPGFTHYETDAGEPCPSYHYDRTLCSCNQLERLKKALEESLKLQAHYAKLLNMHDGGERLIFETVDAWMERLYGKG